MGLDDGDRRTLRRNSKAHSGHNIACDALNIWSQALGACSGRARDAPQGLQTLPVFVKVKDVSGPPDSRARRHEHVRALLPDAAAGTFLDRFSAGARFAASGIAFTLKRPRLLAWAFVPMVVHVALLVFLVWAGAEHVGALSERWGPAADSAFSFLRPVLTLLLLGGLLLVSLVVSLLVGGVVCDPFYDTLSEATESVLLGRDVGQPFSLSGAVQGTLRELSATVPRLAIYLAVAVPLWLLGLTGVGAVVAAPASLAWNWLFVTLSALERSMSRHALTGRARLSALFAQPAGALGFGAVGWGLAHLPFTLPFLVVGGTRLYLALAAWDRVPSNLTDSDKRALRAEGA